ncbi:tetratricopeptide repeat protein [Bdellovibrio svalbardensis]|uniref:Tetratricopeptide repeat protein n=1 Tax=Bdellovibrio svalbardensis TaxID=2972972 RepID=A0ABT6DKK7_9BACT|nr:tetratricopeptide repeat protein [Bdellovibrio svalbardensis]MDG0815643.1 tetratricopeptide repeat protein [Bdellovibrio svalbardensis]
MKKTLTFIAASFLGLNFAFGASPTALGLAGQSLRKQEYRKASNQLYKIVFSSDADANTKMQARYYLGVALMKLKLYQTAAFPLIINARVASPKIAQRSFEKLVLISDNLNDSGLLDYTLKKLDANDLGEIAKELYYNRMGQALMREGKYAEAVTYLQKSLQIKPDNDETLYTLALVYLKENKATEALPHLQKLYDKYFSLPSTNVKRGSAAMAMARGYYQAKRWEDAVNTYREIPKDHALYREAQMELAWSLFRMAKFRSAMSAIQTLHTPFYENFYDPESLTLRSIILLFACQNSEAEKALISFRKNYSSAFTTLSDINNSDQKPEYFFSQIEESQKYLKALKNGTKPTYSGQVPFFIVRASMEEPSLKNKLSYFDRIQQEKNRLAKVFNQPEDAALRKYALKILNSRQKNVSAEAGTVLRNSLIAKSKELALLDGDLDLIGYEVLNAQKKEARADYIRTVNNSEGSQINADDTRDFYVKNGYRYWPFEGEYWRDEIGNYQYLGVNRCDKE